MTHGDTKLIGTKAAYYFYFSEIVKKKRKKENFSKNVSPPSKGEAADGIYDFHQSISVKLITCLLNS